jgi:hypothetical protein
MGLTFWLALAVLLTGLGLAVYGGYVLATGRLSAKARAAFRSTRDAGMYPLCAGAGLMLLALAQLVPDDWDHSFAYVVVALILALTFMGLAFFRYLPRRPAR